MDLSRDRKLGSDPNAFTNRQFRHLEKNLLGVTLLSSQHVIMKLQSFSRTIRTLAHQEIDYC